MKKYIFIIILLFAISCALSAISYAPYAATADVRLETGLPNIPATGLTPGQELPEYINYLFIFGLGLIAFLALGQMMLGGLTYILAAGNVAKVEAAKDTIQQALIGLGLLLVSYLLLNTINPDLVNLRNPNLKPTAFQGLAPTTAGTTISSIWSLLSCDVFDFGEAHFKEGDDSHCATATNTKSAGDHCCARSTTPTPVYGITNWTERPTCAELSSEIEWIKVSDNRCSPPTKPHPNSICCASVPPQ